jgi:RNA polymerase sigma-70 factor, ECF subfamily
VADGVFVALARPVSWRTGRSAPPQAQLEERSLLDACLTGDPEAFARLVEQHQRAVYRLCRRFVATHEDASDLSQEVFLRAYRGLRNFRGQASVSTWLHRIAVNVCLNRVAAKAPKTEAIEEHRHIDSGSPGAIEGVLRRERADRVRAAINELPRKQRATLVLRTYQELSHREIANILGSSVGATKANLFHALRNLKKLLGDEAP